VVDKPVGVECYVIKVVCILFFVRLVLEPKSNSKPINTENLPKRFLTTHKYLFTAHDILGQ